MTLQEAKEFYFQYDGFSFHMGREEPAKYNSFMMLGVGKGTLREWDEELLEGLFESLWSDQQRVWVLHGKILKIIARGNCDAEKQLQRLLDEMEKMAGLDLLTATLIIENMAGRNESMNDGGVYVFRRYFALSGRMNEVTGRIIESCSANHDVDERFEEAVRRYRNAYSKWGAHPVTSPA